MQLPKVVTLNSIRVSKYFKVLSLVLSFALFCFQVIPLYADDVVPPEVEAGGYDSYSCDASGCTFNGLQDGTVFNWDQFNIDLGQTFNFWFNIAGGSVLNNVTGGVASNIFGNLFSNGFVFIVNPAGINIGSMANIDVAGLVASTLSISTANFLSGNYTFENGSQAGSVINEGHIVAQPGGFVVLLGSSVANMGSIVAELGSVVLASGETATITFDPNGLINLSIPEALVSTINNESEVAVANAGLIKADGGKVLLRAETVGNIFTQLVNNTGIIEAVSVVVRNGVIELIGNGGAVHNSGVLNVSGSVENADAGYLRIEGQTVAHSGSILADALEGGLAGYGGIFANNIYLDNGSISVRGLRSDVHARTGSGGGDFELGAGDDIIFDGVNNFAGDQNFFANNDLIFNAGASVNVTGGSAAFQADADSSGAGSFVMNDGSSIFADGGVSLLSDLQVFGNVAITANEGVTVNADITADTGSVLNINTDVDADNSGDFVQAAGSDIVSGGNVFITTNNATITNIDTSSNNGMIGVLSNSGNINVGTMNAGNGTVELAAFGGSILGTAGSLISASTVILSAGNDIGGVGDAIINTAADVLYFIVNTGSIIFNELDSVILNAEAPGSILGNVITGDLLIGYALANHIELNAFGGSILGTAGSLISASTVILTANGNVGGLGDLMINTMASTLNLVSTLGSIFVTESNGAILDATAANDINATTTTGDWTLGTIAATGNVTLMALAGDLLGGVASSVTGTIVNLIAGGADGDVGQAGAAINTTADTLNITGTGTGEVNIVEADGANLNAITDSGNINVTSTTGDWLLGLISTAGSVFINALTGSILDANGAAVNVVAGADSTLEAAGTIGVTADGIDVNITNDATLTVRAGGTDADDTSINLEGVINGEVEDPSANLNFGDPDVLTTPPGTVFFNGIKLFPIDAVVVTTTATGGLTTLAQLLAAGITPTDLLNALFVLPATGQQGHGPSLGIF